MKAILYSILGVNSFHITHTQGNNIFFSVTLITITTITCAQFRGFRWIQHISFIVYVQDYTKATFARIYCLYCFILCARNIKALLRLSLFDSFNTINDYRYDVSFKYAMFLGIVRLNWYKFNKVYLLKTHFTYIKAMVHAFNFKCQDIKY